MGHTGACMSAEKDAIGIRGIGLSLGGRHIPGADLAATHGVPEDWVRRIIGETRVWVADEGTAEDLAVAAARRCLDASGANATDVDAIVWCNGSHRRAQFGAAAFVQGQLGANAAFSFDLGQNCSELVTALRIARSLIRDSGDVRNVLIVSGERWDAWVPRRVMETIDDKNYPSVFSDGGAAVLVGPHDARVLLGFGFASNGRYWDLMQVHPEVVDGEVVERGRFTADFPDDRQLALDLTRLFRSALNRTLVAAGLGREDIRHIVLPLSGPPMQRGFARALGFAPELVVQAPDSPTHIGAPDVVHGLDILLASGRGQPGEHVLVGARSTGLMRFAVVRL